MITRERMTQAEVRSGTPMEKHVATAGTLTPLMEKPKEEIKPPATGGKPRILVIDDKEIVRDLIQRILESRGYEVELAVDGQDGLSKFQPGKFAVVICDREMPNKTGDEVIPAVKKEDPGQKVILCCSGATLIPDDEKARIKADLYFDKPFNVDGLLQAVQDMERRAV